MASNKDSQLLYETNVTPYAMEALTDSGDHQNYTSNATLFSQVSGKAPVVRPDGVISGANGKPAVSGSNDVVDVSKALCNLAGVETSVNADTDLSCTRGTLTDTHIINSVTITSAGAFAVVPGTATTAFSATRGAAGGPPYIPVGSIEVFQVRLTSITAAPITADEIFDVIGTHRESADYPTYEIDYANGEINFDSALPLIHTGDTPRKVYASYADPIFLEAKKANNFVPATNTPSISSEQTYSGVEGTPSEALGTASFDMTLKDGITDDILKQLGEIIWIKHFQNKYKSPYTLTQGLLGVSLSNSATDQPKGSFTLAAANETERRAS